MYAPLRLIARQARFEHDLPGAIAPSGVHIAVATSGLTRERHCRRRGGANVNCKVRRLTAEQSVANGRNWPTPVRRPSTSKADRGCHSAMAQPLESGQREGPTTSKVNLRHHLASVVPPWASRSAPSQPRSRQRLPPQRKTPPRLAAGGARGPCSQEVRSIT
jgi:hypothetical protein